MKMDIKKARRHRCALQTCDKCTKWMESICFTMCYLLAACCIMDMGYIREIVGFAQNYVNVPPTYFRLRLTTWIYWILSCEIPIKITYMRFNSSLHHSYWELWWAPLAIDIQPSDAFSPLRPVYGCAKRQSSDFFAAANDFNFSSASFHIHCSSITVSSTVRQAIRCILMLRLQNIIFWRNFYDGITCAPLISFERDAWNVKFLDSRTGSVFFNEFFCSSFNFADMMKHVWNYNYRWTPKCRKEKNANRSIDLDTGDTELLIGFETFSGTLRIRETSSMAMRRPNDTIWMR